MCIVYCLQPTRGRITVAGEDVRTFDKSEWARVVSIVNQVSSWIFTHLLKASHTNVSYFMKSFLIAFPYKHVSISL